MTKILNLARLERKLRRLPVVAKTAIKSGMEAAANEIVSMMKSLVQVDEGALRDSIGWTWGKAPKGSLAIASVKSGMAADLRAPRMPSLTGASASAMPAINYAPVYNVAQGADPKAIAELRQAQARDRAEFGARVIKTIRGASSTRQKLG